MLGAPRGQAGGPPLRIEGSSGRGAPEGFGDALFFAAGGWGVGGRGVLRLAFPVRV